MAKKVKVVVRLQINAGKANPAPPIGSALGPHQINIMGFCKEYNARTQHLVGQIVPAEITIYTDQTFSFVLKTPPAGDLLKKAAKVSKGASTPPAQQVGTVTQSQIREIAEVKMPDLNAADMAGAMKIIMGTARSMGLTVVD
jgi:large subunit ribosomal protein L11